MKKKILFLCTGNSCRSQMAEGWAKALRSNDFDFYSAGTKKHGLNPLAVKVMQEEGVDISQYKSKTTDELTDLRMDFVFTVCSDADENCPLFLEAKVIHMGFDDPPRLTSKMSKDDEVLAIYRRVRDEIKKFVTNIEDYIEGN